MRLPIVFFFVIFTISGFSGLIYESIWSHYLKLLLGHAAYAQSLVLAIFMGGMAIGSWFASRRSHTWPKLLVGYALVEGIIGILALGFHPGFVLINDTIHNTLIPALGSVALIHVSKWTLAALLILPQSILLGMTFPLMTAGVLRAYPSTPGKSLATLYFCNSIGAAIGVLASGFWLIDAIGLPGTMLTAGTINLALAVCVYFAAPEPAPMAPVAQTNPEKISDSWYKPLLLIAFVTGLASFIYEIVWIRMLTMVLGAATHAFELMLSAFILGLALGGFWIRKRIDLFHSSMGFLAVTQIAMGIFALLSLVAYGYSFELMQWLLRGLGRTDSGHSLFMLMSHGLVLFVMLPTTFCAGMTLPLITYSLLARNVGEKSIGAVYSANTVGAIIGVCFAVHIGMPYLGLKGTLVAGAALDIAAGLGLLFGLRHVIGPLRLPAGAILGCLALVATIFWVHLDPYKMASGVYRYGRASLSHDNTMLYHRDGKTATINVLRTPTGEVSVMTNGKPDAAIQMTPGVEAAPDESTMILAAALPLALRPNARTVANIGMGSGLTTATLLGNSRLETVDTIEIEAAIVEGSQQFRPRVDSAYTDPRSHIYIEDAKTFFSSQSKRYDIIISEPSNPWVSGVASLFSTEFYTRIQNHLNDDSILVQWLQIYEIEVGLVASVVKSLEEQFDNYVIYNSDNSNILILASRKGNLETFDPYIFQQAGLKAELKRVGIENLDDLRLHRIASRKVLEPLFSSYDVPANSDYFPYLDLNAARSRFLQQDAMELSSLGFGPIPIIELLEGIAPPPLTNIHQQTYNTRVAKTLNARAITAYLLGNTHGELASLPQALREDVIWSASAQCRNQGESSLWLDSVARVANDLIPFIDPETAERIWRKLDHNDCRAFLSTAEATYLGVIQALGVRDTPTVVTRAIKLLESGDFLDRPERHGYLIGAALVSLCALGEPQQAMAVWTNYAPAHWEPSSVNIFLRTPLAFALSKLQ